ncbi:MAG: ribonuclease G [Rhodothermales bacterium]|jgi:ribonuclease G
MRRAIARGQVPGCSNSMSKELVVNTDDQTTRIAIVEKGELVELFIETEEHERTLGNLFVGKVRRVMPNIQAAFVDIGQKQDAFLHFSDLGDSLPDWLDYISQEKPDIAKFGSGQVQKHKAGRRRRPLSARPRKWLEDGAEDPEAELAEEQAKDEGERKSVVSVRGRGRRKAGQKSSGGSGHRSGGGRHGSSRGGEDGVSPENFLKRDQPILVKISKEPIAAKGSRVTTDVSLAGRFLVLVPMANYVAVSKKISSFKERRRLRALAKMLLPDGFGVIVRTVAEGQNAKALDTDLRLLREKWQEIESRLAERPTPPAPVYQDVNMVSSIMRDLFSEDFDRILIDEIRMYRNIKGYVQAIAPEMGSKVVHHDSKTPVFRAVNIDRQVAEAFESRVNLPSGGYLFIEQTEAMHVVDVNSGRAGRGLSQEDNSLKVNLESARVIAKQIRLRDLGGILVIDFIDMRGERSRRKVYEAIRSEFRKDRAVTKVLPMSDFGLMQITRQRLRPSVTHTFADLQEELEAEEAGNPAELREPRDLRERTRSADPAGVVGRIEDWLSAFGAASWKGAVRLKVHPFTAAFLSKGLIGFGIRCFIRYRMRVVLEPVDGMDPGRFRFYDETNGKEIRRPPRRGRKEKGRGDREDESKAASDAGERTDEPKGREKVSGDRDSATSASGRSESSRGRRSEGGRPEAGEDSRGRGARNSEDSSGRRSDKSDDSRGRSSRRSAEEKESGGGRDGRSRGGRSRDGASEANTRGRGRRQEEPAAIRNETAENQEATQPSETPKKRTPAARGRGSRKPAIEEAAVVAGVVAEGDVPTAASGSSDAPVEAKLKTKAAPRRRPKAEKETSEPGATEPVAEAPGSTESSAEASARPAPKPRSRAAAKPKKAASETDSKVAEAPDSTPKPEAPAAPAPQPLVEAAAETVRPKTPKVQPFKLRYSSSHNPETETASTE